jgi:hypothetical protein
VVTCLDRELYIFQLLDMYLHDCLSYLGTARNKAVVQG